jgi:hypothetical protein
MAEINNVTAAWSAGTALTVAEIWQCQEGAVRLSTEAAPTAADGILLRAEKAVQFAAGVTVKYKLHQANASTITRTAVSA